MAAAQTPKAKKPSFVPEPLPPLAYALEDAFGGLTFSMPAAIVDVPGDKERVFVVEKTGRIQATANSLLERVRRSVRESRFRMPVGISETVGSSGQPPVREW